MAPNDQRATLIRLAIAAAVLVGGYVGLAAWSAQHLPSTVSVGGIPIGGLSEDEAEDAIATKSEPLLATPISLTVPGREEPVEVVPGEAGFSVDAPGTLEGLTGFSLNPITIWSRLVGSVEGPLLTHVDDDVLTARLTKLAPEVQTKPTEGSVTFPEGKVKVTAPVAGRTLDIAGTKLALRQAFPHSTTATAATKAPIRYLPLRMWVTTPLSLSHCLPERRSPKGPCVPRFAVPSVLNLTRGCREVTHQKRAESPLQTA